MELTPEERRRIYEEEKAKEAASNPFRIDRDQLETVRASKAPIFLVLTIVFFILLMLTPRIVASIPALATMGCGVVSVFRRERARVVSGVLVALCLAVFVIGSMGSSSGLGSRSDSNELSAVEIADWNWSVDPNFGTSGTIKWNVEVRNKSTRNIRSVRVEFSTYDAAGALVSTTFTYVQAIPAGGTRADASYADLYGTEANANVKVVDVSMAE